MRNAKKKKKKRKKKKKKQREREIMCLMRVTMRNAKREHVPNDHAPYVRKDAKS